MKSVIRVIVIVALFLLFVCMALFSAIGTAVFPAEWEISVSIFLFSMVVGGIWSFFAYLWENAEWNVVAVSIAAVVIARFVLPELFTFVEARVAKGISTDLTK